MSSGRSFGLALFLIVVVNIGLLLFRFAYSGTFNNWYLAWNLFLGLLPLLFSYIYYKYTMNRELFSGVSSVLFLFWIIILPNAFYLISDLVHLQESSNKMIVFDAVMFSAFGITGIIFGFLSLALMHYRFSLVSKKYSYLLIIGSLFLSSYAIYLGRYLRWNSWDIITNPFGIIFDISNSFINYSRFTKSIGTTILFFIVLSSLYFVFWTGIVFINESRTKRVIK
jgi:uncharacterized membrane protein